MSIDATAAAQVRYAGFWRRLVAFVIDTLTVFLVLVPVALFHGIVFGIVGGVLSLSEEVVDSVWDPIGVGVGIVVTWLYFAVLESSEWQATCGKRALGLVVTDLAGQRIGFVRATIRHFAKILSSVFAGAGFLLIAGTSQKQALHDGIAKTLVVRRSRQLAA